MKGARQSGSACDLTSSDSRSEDERRAVDFSARQRERGRLWRVFYSVPFVAFPCDHTGPLPQDRGASGRMSKTPPSCASASHSAVEHGNRMPSTTCAVGATSPSRDALGHERQNRGSEGRNRPAYLERREEHLDQRNGTRDCAQRLLYGVSYMAEKISVFGIVVGVALLLTGIGLVILAFAVFGRNRSEREVSPA